MRLLVRGPNGAGKSTLAKALAGRLPLLAGRRVEEAEGRLRVGYFTQVCALNVLNLERYHRGG